MYYKILKPYNLLTCNFKIKTLDAGEIIPLENIDSFANFENIVIANPEYFKKCSQFEYEQYLQSKKYNKILDIIISENLLVDSLIQTLQSDCVLIGDILITDNAKLNFVLMSLKNGNYDVETYDHTLDNPVQFELESAYKKIFPKTQFENIVTLEVAEFVRTFYYGNTWYILLNFNKGFDVLTISYFLKNYRFKKDQIIELSSFSIDESMDF